jgi:hypothetical protein
MEYMAHRYFSQVGYVCENQIPLSHSLGSPDFGGYSIPGLYDALNEFGISVGGINVVELAMLSYGGIISGIVEIDKKVIVGEAKTSTTIMEKQLLKYLDSGYFDLGVEIHPFKGNASRSSFGLLNFNKDYKIQFTQPKNGAQYVVEEKLVIYQSWLTNYVKYYLIANMSNSEFQEFYKARKGVVPSSRNEVSSFINSLKFVEILNRLKELKII